MSNLLLVNVTLEANVLAVVRETVAEGGLPGLRIRDKVVVARDRKARACLVAGMGALGVGLQWQVDAGNEETLNFEDALEAEYKPVEMKEGCAT